MVKLTVLYGQPEDPTSFDEHYKTTHTPLVEKIPNLKRFEAAKVVGTPGGSQSEYYWVAELWFESMEQFQNALGGPEGQEASSDVPNFATGGAKLLVCEVQG